ncbi:site-specific DNA-methyltransferase [Caldovatus aquaticus]|uniref:Methyltransferase n=1 Tax=Caldovatus aquaticus TaxID=2865671 RepID=A0ABS7F668_9PROT|nr:site-specific DNA-methyltransferase [Caldovatus aquaticus]MBW8271110.1 site-specific DNA-methyltransferase [Caldovatus aquaticus]
MQPDLRVTTMAVAALVPYAENARTHSEAQVAQIAASIAEFGFVNPVLVDAAGVLVAGHGRVMAAKRLGMAAVPAIRLSHLTEAQARALRLADNQIALNSGWDEALLAAEIARIRDEAAVDLDVLGFSGMELDRLLAAADAGLGEDGADDAPPPPAVPVTRAGDLWRCGEHRLLCGDATRLDDVQRALGADRLADMAFTDPPYNVAYRGGTAARMTIANDALGEGFLDFLRPALANLLSVTKGACYVCMSSSEWPTLHRAWQEAGGKWSSTIIWAKNTFALGRADYHQQFEAMLYGWKQGAQHYWCGARDQGNVWHFDKPARNDLHPTMKPVALVERAIRNSSKQRDTVLDLFGGSGTTMIAAERTGRRAVLLELDPAYADVVVRRWQEATGEAAVLEGEERTFGDIAAARGAGDAGMIEKAQ